MFVVSLVDLISGVCCVPAALVGFVQDLSASSASRRKSIGGTHGGVLRCFRWSLGRPVRALRLCSFRCGFHCGRVRVRFLCSVFRFVRVLLLCLVYVRSLCAQ